MLKGNIINSITVILIGNTINFITFIFMYLLLEYKIQNYRNNFNFLLEQIHMCVYIYLEASF